MLSLSEELFLALHFDEKEGTIVPLDPSTSHLITAGGLTTELLLAGCLRLDEDQLVVVNAEPTGDDLFDESLRRLQPAVSFQSDDAEWFNAVAQKVALGDLMLVRLLEKGVIRPLQKSKWFGLSNTTVYPLQDDSITQRWHQVQLDVLVNGAPPKVNDALLLFMTRAWGGQLPANLSRKEWKTAESRWSALFGDYLGAYPVGETSKTIPGLEPATALAIGQLTISWATVQAGFVYSEIANNPLTN